MHASIAQVPNTEVSPDAVRAQLRRILASPFFGNSKRYPVLLEYVVNQVLAGKLTDLKERTLGVEVFHRSPDYDTNADPVVRISAGEIRKRLAQYYCDPEHENELRIEIPSGSYVPEFHLPAVRLSSEFYPEPRIASHTETVAEPQRKLRYPKIIIAAVLAVFAMAFAGMNFWPRKDAVSQFWGPVLQSKSPVLICLGQLDPYVDTPADLQAQAAADTKLGYHMVNSDRVVMGDVFAAAKTSTVLGKYGLPYVIQGANSVTYVDMQKGPVVLVSGADNSWTMRITSPLRFHFVRGSGNVFRIEDRQNPSQRDWYVDFDIPYASLKKDYAIVGRFLDSTTGQNVIVVAGIGVNGTVSAGEFVSNANYVRSLLSRLPAKPRNFEAVISTEVIDGKSGPPSVLAVHSW